MNKREKEELIKSIIEGLVVGGEKEIMGVKFRFINNAWVALIGDIAMVMEEQDDGKYILGLCGLSKESLDLVIQFVRNLGGDEENVL